jgi:hypothetical protein
LILNSHIIFYDLVSGVKFVVHIWFMFEFYGPELHTHDYEMEGGGKWGL